MTSEIVREGRAASSRIRQGDGTWEDWKEVGCALLEGRAIAARYARPNRVGGKGYGPAFNDWLSDNRLYERSPSSRRRIASGHRHRHRERDDGDEGHNERYLSR
jgi:hypothetical protein